jgi:hypothetical protein
LDLAKKKDDDSVDLEIIYEHQLNFGTADHPDYKTAGDVVNCNKSIAENLVNGGFAVYVKKEADVSGD